ncbi:hypothetical protein IGI01_22045 [Bacillus thuringiensis]|nr:hypothetical protein [Bacillus thuringiensis]
MLVVIGLFTYITLTTKNPLSEKEFPITHEKAKETSIEYLKKEKQLDVVITEGGGVGEICYEVLIEGHVHNDEHRSKID